MLGGCTLGGGGGEEEEGLSLSPQRLCQLKHNVLFIAKRW